MNAHQLQRSIGFAMALVLTFTLAPGAVAQHGEPTGHLHGSGGWGDLELASQARLTGVPGLIADVAVSPDGQWAYLANAGDPDCAANSEAGGRSRDRAGVHVVDISDLENPQQVGFIPHHRDSRPGERMQVVDISTNFFSGQMLVMNSKECGKNGIGGVVLWDVRDPRKPARLSAHFGDRGVANANDIDSAFAWDAGDRAYAVIVDTSENADLDILDITNPRRPWLVAEYNLNTYIPGGVSQPELGLEQSLLHDMVVQEIDGRFIMLVSYGDGGFVQLDVTNPQSAEYIGDTDYAAIDPQLLESTGIALPPEGNAHHAEFTADDRFFIGTDLDFARYRSIFTIDSGDNAGEYAAGEFGWTAPVISLPDGKLNGPTVYGGYGCPGSPALPNATDVFPSVAEGEERIVVLQRGPDGDPSTSVDACLYSEKVEAAQNAGYDGVVVANHHAGAQGGDAPDAHLCGSQGHEFDAQIPAVCTGHRAFHLIFAGAPHYTYPEANPATGQVGEQLRVTPTFDGWGYVHLFDGGTLQDLDTYAIPEAHDADFAFGFGNLTVHEVATHPTTWDRAYLAYYSGGIRALEIQCDDPEDTSMCELVEVGGYLDPDGNDFWGVEAFVRDGQTIVLGSDRDSGLWIFRDTAP